MNVIYILECLVCGLQYVDEESKQPFHKRLNGHRSDVSKKLLLQVSLHFKQSGHKLDDFNRMKVLVIEQNIHWSYAHAATSSGKLLDKGTKCTASKQHH